MGISVFPSGGGAEFITNDFVIDMNDTTNNVADLGRSYAPGSYGVSLSSGDTSFDIYALDADGNSVGYTNQASLVADAQFTQIVILGVSPSEVISFDYDGEITNTTGEGTAPGAGAYLETISPSDLPNINDTANVVGGNFATDVEIYFESGTVSTIAKNITRSDSTALIVTRPDQLDPALDPWDVKAINPGVTPPVGTNDHILAGTVDAGATPVWQTTSPLPGGQLEQAYTTTLEATDADGAVSYSITAGTLQAGLSLDTSTGVISGTPTENGSETFTVQALDGGGNSNEREFTLSIVAATGGTVTQSGNYTYHTFNSTDDFELFADKTVEWAVIAGGGGGFASQVNQFDPAGGGGGAGGVRVAFVGQTQTPGNTGIVESALALTAGTYTATVGAGGQEGIYSGGFNQTPSQGSSSSFSNINTVGGGRGGGGNGGSGGGGNEENPGGSGTANQGFDGGGGGNRDFRGGGGGGATGAGSADLPAGNGIILNGLADEFARGGRGGSDNQGATSNTAGSGGGGGALGSTNSGAPGRDGVVILRYE